MRGLPWKKLEGPLEVWGVDDSNQHPVLHHYLRVEKGKARPITCSPRTCVLCMYERRAFWAKARSWFIRQPGLANQGST